MRNCWVSNPKQLQDRVEQADLRAGRLFVLVDELPDDAGADHRDRHRQEDQGLGEGLAARAVDEDRVDQPDAGREDRDEDDPQGRVAQHEQQLGLGEHRRVVAEGESTLTGAPAQRLVDREDRGVHQPDGEQDHCGADEQGALDPLAVLALEQGGEEEHEAEHEREEEDREEHQEELAGHALRPQERLGNRGGNCADDRRYHWTSPPRGLRQDRGNQESRGGVGWGSPTPPLLVDLG